MDEIEELELYINFQEALREIERAGLPTLEGLQEVLDILKTD